MKIRTLSGSTGYNDIEISHRVCDIMICASGVIANEQVSLSYLGENVGGTLSLINSFKLTDLGRFAQYGEGINLSANTGTVGGDGNDVAFASMYFIRVAANDDSDPAGKRSLNFRNGDRLSLSIENADPSFTYEVHAVNYTFDDTPFAWNTHKLSIPASQEHDSFVVKDMDFLLFPKGIDLQNIKLEGNGKSITHTGNSLYGVNVQGNDFEVMDPAASGNDDTKAWESVDYALEITAVDRIEVLLNSGAAAVTMRAFGAVNLLG